MVFVKTTPGPNFICSICRRVQFVKDSKCEYCNKKMSELKTLNSICKCPECTSVDESCVDYQLLRDEAIKWIKNCTAESQSSRGTLIQCGEMSICPACQRFKRFFNLTDEDLK